MAARAVLCVVTMCLASVVGLAQSEETIDGESTLQAQADKLPPLTKSEDQPVNIQVSNASTDTFPVIRVNVSVWDQDRNGITGLDEDDFRLTEKAADENTPVLESIEVTQAESLFDNAAISLVYDRSTSMSQELPEAKQAGKEFISNFENSDRAALVSFASSVRIDQPFLFTDDDGKARISGKIDSLVARGSTAFVDGVWQAVELTAQETGAKAVIAFADGEENASSRSLRDLIQRANEVNVPVYTIGLGFDVAEDPLRELATRTGGAYYFSPSAAELEQIYEDIRQSIAQQYILVYRTHRPVEDGTLRFVNVEVEVDGATDDGSTQYTALLPPRIFRTEATRLLSFTSATPNQPLVIQAEILSASTITSATLYYRRIGSDQGFDSAPMLPRGGSLFEGRIPAEAAREPGVAYYIVASDGVTTSANPATLPQQNAHQIPVGAPGLRIRHVPVTVSPYDADVPVSATVVSDSASVDEVILHYKRAEENLYRSLAMSLSSGDRIDGVWQGAIPAETHASPPGSDYYIEAFNGDGRRVSFGTPEEPLRVNYRPSTIYQGFEWDDDGGSLRVLARAFDPVNGRRVTEGQADFSIYDADGNRIRYGGMLYDFARESWESTEMPWSRNGRFVYSVTINGQTASMPFTTGSQIAVISGTTREAGGDVLAGTRVTLQRGVDQEGQLRWVSVASTEAGPDGRFSFPPRDPGAYRLRAMNDPLQGESGGFYGIGSLEKDIYLANYELPLAKLDELARELERLQKRQAKVLSDASAEIDGYATGGDLWSEGIDAANFVSSLVSLRGTAKTISNVRRLAARAGGWNAVLRGGGRQSDLLANGVSRQAVIRAGRAAEGDLAKEVYSTGLGAFGPLFDPGDREEALFALQARKGLALSEREGLDTALAVAFHDEFQQEVLTKSENRWRLLDDTKDFFIPPGVSFQDPPFWPFGGKEDRVHYRSQRRILNSDVANWSRSWFDLPTGRILRHWKSMVDQVPVDAENLDTSLLARVIDRQIDQIRTIRGSAAEKYVSPYGDMLPINFNARMLPYRDSVKQLKRVLAAKTLKLAVDIGLTVAGVATGGAALVAKVAVSTAASIALQRADVSARADVVTAYGGLPYSWGVTQLYLPHVMDRTGSFMMMEMVDPVYTSQNAGEKYRASIAELDMNPDRNDNGMPVYFGGPFVDSSSISFKIRSEGTQKGEFGAIVKNVRKGPPITGLLLTAWNPLASLLLFGEIPSLQKDEWTDQTIDFWVAPSESQLPNDGRRRIGLELEPGQESERITVPFTPRSSLEYWMNPRYVAIETLAGPLVSDLEIVNYAVLLPTSLTAKGPAAELHAVMGGKRLTASSVADYLAQPTDLGGKSAERVSRADPERTFTYQAPKDAWQVLFMLSSNSGKVQLHIYEDGDHVGWNPGRGGVDVDFPARPSGVQGKVQQIVVPNAAGREFRVVARLDAAAASGEYPYDVEAVAIPRREDAVMTVLPERTLSVRGDGPFTLTTEVAESGRQTPLENVAVTVGELVNGDGEALTLVPAATMATQEVRLLPAGEKQAISWRYQQPPAEGTYTGTIGFESDAGSLEQQVKIVVAQNEPPVADAGPDQEAECQGPFGAEMAFDGSESFDPDDDALSYAWESSGCEIDDPAAEVASATCPLGSNTMTLVVNDGELDSAPDQATGTVVDTLAPEGSVSWPESGACLNGPVEVRDEFTDVCDPQLERTYEPGPGPVYEEEGEWQVTLIVEDGAGNTGSDAVGFVIDDTKPVVIPREPIAMTQSVPRQQPFGKYFATSDDDLAPGGVVREALSIDGCVLFDGGKYGDGDGLLTDESVTVPRGLLCRYWSQCQSNELRDATLVIEAEDCAGNVGRWEQPIPGHHVFDPGVCGP